MILETVRQAQQRTNLPVDDLLVQLGLPPATFYRWRTRETEGQLTDDVSSIGLLFHLSRSIAESRILLLGTYRPEDVALGRTGERHPLESVINEIRRYHGDVWLDLGQIAAAEGRAFVDAGLDTEPNRLDEDFRQALFRRTNGHTLFTTELLREMQDRGDIVQDEAGQWVVGLALDWGALPAKVEGVIAERIGRLEGGLRELLTIASVEGEDFTAQVLARVQNVNQRELARRLTQELDQQHRLIREQGVVRVLQQRLSQHRFRHALFQKYLYDNLGEMERMYLHEDVGNVLEVLYGEQTEEIAVQLARHFQAAGMTEKAVAYLLQAGNRARRLSANEEAIELVTKGLELLETLPDTPERIQQELDLQITLGLALRDTSGYIAPEVGQAFARAHELCPQVGETSQLPRVLLGLWGFHVLGAKLQTARELANQFFSLAQRVGDTALILEAHRHLGATLFWLGDVSTTQVRMEQVIAHYHLDQHHSNAFLYGQDPAVAALSYQSWCTWLLGYPDQALKKSAQAVGLGKEVSHPFSLAYALVTAAEFHAFRRDVQATQERAGATIVLCTEQSFSVFGAWGTILHGTALTRQGQVEEGIEQIRQGLATLHAAGQALILTLFQFLSAEAYGMLGHSEQGLSVLTEDLAAVNRTDERWNERCL